MGRRKVENRNVRKLSSSGGGRSYSITIPIEFVRKLRWKNRQKVVVDLKGKTITIRDWPALTRKIKSK